MFLSDLTMRLLMELDAPADQKVALLHSMRADEAAVAVATRKRAVSRERQAKHRATSRDNDEQGVTRRYNDEQSATERDSASPPRAHVEDTSSSLRSEDKPPISPDGEMRPRLPIAKPNGFARFWEAYPNKVGKAAAEKAYAKAIRSLGGPDPPGAILAGVERAKASRPWREGFIPHPTTWLNRGSWDDQPAEVIPINRQVHERPDPRKAKSDAYIDHLADIDAAMAAGLQQPRRSV